jgi:hypothetical protein
VEEQCKINSNGPGPPVRSIALSLISSRQRAAQAQNYFCFYCHAPMWEADLAGFAVRYGLTRRQAENLKCTAEHLLRRKHGGGHNPANIAAACLRCNQLRHKRQADLTPEEFKSLVSKRLRARRWHDPKILRIIAHRPG